MPRATPLHCCALALLLWCSPLQGQEAGTPMAGSGPVEAAAPGDLPEEILINLRLGRIAERLVPAVRVGSTPYLPLAPFLELSEVEFREGDAGVVRAVRQPGAIEIVIDAPRGRARLDGQAISRAEGEILWWGERVLVSPHLLETLLGVTIHTNFSDLHAVVLDPEVLPIGRRLERERRRRHFNPEGGPEPANLTLDRTPYRTGGLVLDWSASAEPDRVEESANLALGLGAQILGGSLQLSTRSAGPITDGDFPLGASYHRAWPERRLLRQIRLGDGLGSGPRPRAVRGIHLTNAPYVRDSHFGTEALTGRLGPGWEVELRRHGRTVDMTRADEQGAFALDIPLSYGTNPVEVVAFGAHGEVVTMERLILLRQNRIPQGRFEWGLSGGECTGDGCVGAANADLRFGLTDRWTLRAGTDAFVRDTLPEGVHPYLEVAGALSSSLQVSVEGVLDGFVRGVVDWTPSTDLRLRAAHALFRTGLDAPMLHDARRRATTEADLFWRVRGGSNRWTVRGSAVHEERADDWRLRWQALMGIEAGGFRWEGGVREQGRYLSEEEGRPVGPFRVASPGLRQVASVRGRIPLPSPTALSPWLMAEVEMAEWERATAARLRLSYPVTRQAQLNLTGDWDPRGRHRFSAALQATFDPVRSVTQLFGGANEEIRTIQYAQGNVQWNEATGGVRLDSGPGVERAGISGYVFLDENGNGRWDPGEPALSGVRVVVEGRVVETDASGRYDIWDLTPYEMTRVALDPLSLRNPLWVPADGTIDLPLAPSSYRRLDLPVVPGQEIGGRVVRIDAEGREFPVAGLEIIVADLLRGGESTEVTTFSDGSFHLLGLRPGAYELRVPPELLQHIELRQDHPDRAVVVRPDRSTSSQRVVIRLVPHHTATTAIQN